MIADKLHSIANDIERSLPNTGEWSQLRFAFVTSMAVFFGGCGGMLAGHYLSKLL